MLCFIFAAWGAIYKPFSTGQNISFKMIAFILFYLVILLAGFSLLCHMVIFNHFNPWPAWLGLFAYFAFLGC